MGTVILIIYTVLYLLQINTSPFEPSFGTYNIIPTTSAKTLEDIQNYKGIEPYVDEGTAKLNNVTGQTQIVSSQNGIITLTPTEQKALQQAQNSQQISNSQNQPATNNGPISNNGNNVASGNGNNNNVTKIDNASSNQVTTDNKNGTPGVINQSQSSIDKAKAEAEAKAKAKAEAETKKKDTETTYIHTIAGVNGIR